MPRGPRHYPTLSRRLRSTERASSRWDRTRLVCALYADVSRGDRANQLTGVALSASACGERKIVVGTDDSKMHFYAVTSALDELVTPPMPPLEVTPRQIRADRSCTHVVVADGDKKMVVLDLQNAQRDPVAQYWSPAKFEISNAGEFCWVKWALRATRSRREPPGRSSITVVRSARSRSRRAGTTSRSRTGARSGCAPTAGTMQCPKFGSTGGPSYLRRCGSRSRRCLALRRSGHY